MRKENRTYYFSVEGDTEQWYLEWLQRKINAEPAAKYTVKLDSKVEKDPVKRTKRLTIIGKTEITHLCDYESGEEKHQKEFRTVMDRMKEAQNSGKTVKYYFGYSNFTFELWILLHMTDCHTPLAHREQYLPLLNRTYKEKFENLKQYKEEENFKRLLERMTLENVRQAIGRAKLLMGNHEKAGHKLQKYKGYQYYRENPSLAVWEQIEKILKECGLM